MAKFPTLEWAQAFSDKLNSDQQYAQIAHNWEGDFYFIIEPGGAVTEQVVFYFDLWHGKCRETMNITDMSVRKPAFILKSPYENFKKVVSGEMHPMTAMMTGKLHVQGNMAIMMRSVPTILDFVRCAKEVTDSFV